MANGGPMPEIKLDGLSDTDVEKRLAQYGPNEVISTPYPEWKKIVKRFTGIVPIIMIITAILGVAIDDHGNRDWISFGLLIFELLLVVTVDYLSDRNAGNAIKAVKDLSAPECHCKRNGKWVKAKVVSLVPGDICFLGGGVVIPADGVLVGSGEPIQVDESSLTGEALAVTKVVGDEVLAGAIVQSGELDMMVTNTGEHSFFGKTLALLGSVQEAGHLKKTLAKVAKIMALIGLLGVVVIFFVRLGRSQVIGDVVQSIKLCFVILTAVVPIAMPVVTTTVLSVGALDLSKEDAVVTRLSAIEEMAGIEVLCSDKTGTLTLNHLTLDIGEIRCAPGFEKDYVLVLAALASKLDNQEPIDKAITNSLPRQGEELKEYTVTRFLPFNPVDKKTEATVILPDGTTRIISKGAPHIIQQMIGANFPEIAEGMSSIINEKAERGLRTLGVCWKTESSVWEYVGLISLFDPPRSDTKQTIEESMNYGVDVKMVTGDQRAIAIETARRLGMGTNIVGSEIWTTESTIIQDKGGLGDFIMSVNGFSGVYPEHKFKIVEALQNMGKLVGMTGDGVNDAPALKKANVGVAVAGATDAAKGAADIILLRPGLSTIISALLISRTIFQRIQNYIMYRMASSLLILLFFFLSISISNYSFPTWTLILLSLVNDMTIMATSKDNVVTSALPQHWNMQKVITVAATLGITNVIGAYLLLFLAATPNLISGGINWWTIWGLSSLEYCDDQFKDIQGNCVEGVEYGKLNACMYLCLAMLIQLNIFSTRTRSLFFWFDGKTAKPPSWIVIVPVLGSIILSTVLMNVWTSSIQLGGGAPLEGIDWGHIFVIWLYAFVWFLIGDLMKWLVMAKLKDDEYHDIMYGSLIGAGELNAEEIQLEAKRKVQKLRNAKMNGVLEKEGISARLAREDEGHKFLRKRTVSQVSMFESHAGVSPTEARASPTNDFTTFERMLTSIQQQVQGLVDWKNQLERSGIIPKELRLLEETDL